MDAAQAISLVVEEIRREELDYPTLGLTAAQFAGGWCVYAPEILADDGPQAPEFDEVTRSVFLVGDSTGEVEQVESTESAADARAWFEEAAIWFGARQPGGTEALATSTVPGSPDLGGSSRVPRRAAAYDQQALNAFAEALMREPDFPGWLADRVRELADLVGGRSRLIARRHRSSAAEHVSALAEPEDDADYYSDEPRTGVWQTWPRVDPASLPEVDTTGWLLIPGVAACEFLESMESDTDAATRLADAVADQVRPAPPWRALGAAELLPQLVALRRGDLADADLAQVRRVAVEFEAGEAMDRLFAPVPGDADVEALLRLAIDAHQRDRKVIDIDAAATAAYRRVLDRLELPFENYMYEAMFE
jgi:hypothetical protein